MTETRIELDGGKYTVIKKDGGHMTALRHGEPWRDLAGDNLVYWLAVEIERLTAELAALRSPAPEVCDYCNLDLPEGCSGLFTSDGAACRFDSPASTKR